ncbi:MAG: VPLPA-CTERM sorting domain-containing protein, partial [Pseudomonadota bacterium]
VAQAATVISVAGPDEQDGALIATDGTSPNPGVGTSFTLTSLVKNASFEFDFFCGVLLSNCAGSLSLTSTGLSPASVDLSSVETFSSGPGTSTLTAFDGFDLAAGTWSVLLTLDDDIDQWGVWAGSENATETNDGRGTAGGSQLIDDLNPNFPVASVFEDFGDNTLYWTLKGDAVADTPDMSPVPLPASALFFGSGLIGLGFLRRARRRS